MERKKITSVLCFILLLNSGCCIFSKNPCNPEPPITTTNDSVCDSGIKIFNANVTNVIIRDIIESVSKKPSIQTELKGLYPEARDTWNNALSEIEKKYSSDWSGVSLPEINRDEFGNWRNSNLQNFQKFFLLLNESLRGSIPNYTPDLTNNSMDSDNIRYLMENGDIKRILDKRVKVLQGVCPNRDPVKVRALLNIMRLPATFEECLQPKP